MSNNKLCVVFLVVCFTSVVLCGDLFVVRASSEEGNGVSLALELTKNGFDVYGHYGDVVLASPKTEEGLLYFQQNELDITKLGDLMSNYYVIERPERHGVAFTEALTVPQSEAQTLFSTYNRIVVTSPSSELQLSPDFEVLPISHTPIKIGSEVGSFVTEIYESATQKYLVAPHASISELVAAVDPEVLRAFTTYLTGEDGVSGINSRNSIATGSIDASKWISQKFTGWGLEVSFQEFRVGYSSNVIGIKKGYSDASKVVVVGAHYDSRGTSVLSATQRAPGANDNGSGTGAVLQLAKVLHDFNSTFDYTIHFVTFSGEEQGLYGSAAYAKKLADENVDVIGVLNADMVAYRVSTEPTQCAFPSRYSTLALENIAKEATKTYVPEITIGTTNACCSDHQSFYGQGFPATGFFERNGAIADPMYHRSEDVVNRPGYDIGGEYTQLTRAVLATLATVAGVHEKY